jgi:hypothetical protein
LGFFFRSIPTNSDANEEIEAGSDALGSFFIEFNVLTNVGDSKGSFKHDNN